MIRPLLALLLITRIKVVFSIIGAIASTRQHGLCGPSALGLRLCLVETMVPTIEREEYILVLSLREKRRKPLPLFLLSFSHLLLPEM